MIAPDEGKDALQDGLAAAEAAEPVMGHGDAQPGTSGPGMPDGATGCRGQPFGDGCCGFYHGPHMSTHPAADRPRWAANLLGLDYRKEAARFARAAESSSIGGSEPSPAGITDIHIHINGRSAARIYREVAECWGIGRMLTQTRLDDAAAVREVFGDRVQFVAVPNWGQADKGVAFRQGFLDNMTVWAQQWGARVVKFWAAPRLWELLGAGGADATDIVPLDSEWRVRHAERAMDLGMMFMTHIGDPDTWFQTRYADATVYRMKRDYYLSLERMLDRFPSPWIGAHMGGYPEDLDFLSGLLLRHDNLYLDTSATKWVVRELSRHPRGKVREFFERWQGRVLFGSDIVTLDDHLAPRPADTPPSTPMSDLATSPEQAFELYASRYWALRTMLETGYDGPSPIADPDLAMVDPQRFTPMDSPRLQGLELPEACLRSLYHDAAESLVYRWIREHA